MGKAHVSACTGSGRVKREKAASLGDRLQSNRWVGRVKTNRRSVGRVSLGKGRIPARPGSGGKNVRAVGDQTSRALKTTSELGGSDEVCAETLSTTFTRGDGDG